MNRLWLIPQAMKGVVSSRLTNLRTSFGVAALLAAFAICPPPTIHAESDQESKSNAQLRYSKSPLSFEANRGQTDPNVKFVSRGAGYTIFLLPTEAILNLRRSEKGASEAGHHSSDPTDGIGVFNSQLKIRFVGSNPSPQVTGVDEFSGKVHYLIGSEPKAWRSDIPSYAKVRYASVYPGIDIVYYGNQRNLEYDFVVAPGADPRQILFNFTGAETLEADSNGDLILRVAGKEVRQHRPVVYQEIEGVRREIVSAYVIKEDMQVKIEVADYDSNAHLIIDPVLSYSTYLGGSGFDQAYAIAVDALGNAYVTGLTDSIDFPVASPLQSLRSGSSDVFVAKLNATGDALLYSTYIGGSGIDEAYGIAVDSAGNAYVAGFTDSFNFPTVNAVQPANRGSRDGFVAKLNATGSALVYSTYLGGSGFDENFAIAIDSLGNAYVTGLTTSSNFPLVNPIQPFLGGSDDAFVAKLDASGSALIYSTYIGGSGFDEAFGIAVDSSGSAYITGQTGSPNFPIINALQPAFGGGFSDAFVTKLNAQGSALAFSTYLGGSGADTGEGIALNVLGNAYIVGGTNSTDLPTVNAVQPAFGFGVNNAFVSKLNAQGTALDYSTYLPLTVSGNAIAVDSSGSAYVTGSGCCADSDAFVIKLNDSGSAILYSIQLGGSHHEVGSGIAVDSLGNAYVVGETDSANFPTVNPLKSNCSPLPQDPSRCLSLEAFVTKISTESPPPPVIVVANAGEDQIVVCGNDCRAIVTLNGLGSKGNALHYLWTGPFGTVSGATPSVSLSKGQYVISLTVTDSLGHTSSDTVAITVVDATPPTITAVTASPNVLLQANHQMVPVTVAVSASDNCDPSVVCRIISVASSEPVDGLGDGDTSPDWFVTGDFTLDVRAERSGNGTGRIYTISVECTDLSGNKSTSIVVVTVPRNN